MSEHLQNNLSGVVFYFLDKISKHYFGEKPKKLKTQQLKQELKHDVTASFVAKRTIPRILFRFCVSKNNQARFHVPVENSSILISALSGNRLKLVFISLRSVVCLSCALNNRT
jgi:hypothetical protein